jgi:hypothetical protein
MNDLSASPGIREIFQAVRYVGSLIKQLPVQPLLAALLISCVLGVIPIILTVVCSAARTASYWFRQSPRLRRDESGTATCFNELLKLWELR